MLSLFKKQRRVCFASGKVIIALCTVFLIEQFRMRFQLIFILFAIKLGLAWLGWCKSGTDIEKLLSSPWVQTQTVDYWLLKLFFSLKINQFIPIAWMFWCLRWLEERENMGIIWEDAGQYRICSRTSLSDFYRIFHLGSAKKIDFLQLLNLCVFSGCN